MDTAVVPDIRAIADHLLGKPYEDWDCWAVLRHCLQEGWGIELDTRPAAAMYHVTELWCYEDEVDPLSLIQPWDVLIYRTRGPASSHVGLVVDQQYFLHTQRRIGVCLEPCLRWKSRLLQIARLRQLLAA